MSNLLTFVNAIKTYDDFCLCQSFFRNQSFSYCYKYKAKLRKTGVGNWTIYCNFLKGSLVFWLNFNPLALLCMGIIFSLFLISIQHFSTSEEQGSPHNRLIELEHQGN